MAETELEKEIRVMNEPGTDGPRTDPPGTDAPGTSAPGTDAPGTAAPGTSAPETSAPETKAPSTDAPATKAPETAAPTTDAPPDEEEDELELLKKQNEALRGQIEEFAGGPPPPKEPTTKTAAPTTTAPLGEIDFMEGADMEDVTGDSKALNALLNKVYQAGARSSSESTLRAIPDIVRANAIQHTNLGAATAQFYTNNEDLAPFKKTVAAVGMEIVAEHSDWPVEKVLEETGKVTRERLALHKKVTNTTPTKKPKFAKAPKGKAPRGEKPKTTAVQREIEEMNAADAL